jgi:hypothetical protein
MIDTDFMIDTIRTIDEIFIRLAEASVGTLPIDAAVEEMWEMLARGDLRLVADGERLRVEPVEDLRPGRWRRYRRPAERSLAERIRLARQYRPIVEARWRVLCGSQP